MRGLETVARAIADVVSTDIVDRLDVLQGELGQVQPIGTDPTPKFVFWTMQEVNQVPADDYPFVLVIARDVPTMHRTGVIDAGIVYEVRYRLRLLSLARGSGYEDTAAVRARLSLALREVVLARQTIADGLRLDEASLRESFSDVQFDPGDERTVAGAYLDLVYACTEVLTPRAAALGQQQQRPPVAVGALP